MKKMQQLRIKTEEKKITACAFTGHRTLEEDCSFEKIVAITEDFIRQGVEIFYNGMAMGFDLLAAEAVLSLKKAYPHIKLVACIPCYHQERSFKKEDKERYTAILRAVDEQVLLSEHYYQGCMQVRDQYMVDRCDCLIAYCKKTTGGAAYTVKYCQKRYPEKEIYFV